MEVILNIGLAIIFVFVVGILLIIAWLLYDFYTKEIYYPSLRYESFSSTAIVYDKKYEEEYVSMNLMKIEDLFFTKNRIREERYMVYLIYEEKEYQFDDKYLYDIVNVGDSVDIEVYKGYNQQDKLKHVYISTR